MCRTSTTLPHNFLRPLDKYGVSLIHVELPVALKWVGLLQIYVYWPSTLNSLDTFVEFLPINMVGNPIDSTVNTLGDETPTRETSNIFVTSE